MAHPLDYETTKEALLAAMQARGLEPLSPEEIDQFASLFRRATGGIELYRDRSKFLRSIPKDPEQVPAHWLSTLMSVCQPHCAMMSQLCQAKGWRPFVYDHLKREAEL